MRPGTPTLLALLVSVLAFGAALVFPGPFAVFWAMLAMAVLMMTVLAFPEA